MAFCPTCGQPLLIRYGVKLTPKKARLLDLIERREAGVATGTLAETLYPGEPADRTYQRVKVTVNQINDLLAATNYRIINSAGFYRLAKVAP